MSARFLAAEADTNDPYKQAATYYPLAVLVVLLIAITWFGLQVSVENRARHWLIIMALMTAFIVVTGKTVTNHWRGILIGQNNRLSLGRLQTMAWTVLILSALLTAALANVSFGWDSPMNIVVPSDLWVVMGISTASLVAAPAILGSKRDKKPAAGEEKRMKTSLAKQGFPKVSANLEPVGVVVRNREPDEARWADLFKGDELGNAATVDFAKLQMFFFTFVLVFAYGSAIAAMFREEGPVTALPQIEQGMYVLLGISHTGYLANKTVTHTKEVGSRRP